MGAATIPPDIRRRNHAVCEPRTDTPFGRGLGSVIASDF